MLTTVFRLGNVDTDAAERYEREQPEALRRARQGDQAPDRRQLGPLVAEDAAARRGVVQLPAHDRARRVEGGRPDRGRAARARPHPRRRRLCARAPARVRALHRHRRGAADRRAPDAHARRRVRHDQGGPGASAPASPTRSHAAATTRRPIARCCRGRSKACSSLAATTRPPRRRRRCRARFRPAWRWAKRPGVAAAMALDAGVRVRDVDVKALQARLRAQGADPGDQSGPNADVPAIARQIRRQEAA